MVRKKYSKKFQTQIALDAIKDQKTITELASEYGVHANQISMWKSSYSMLLLQLLAVEKIKTLTRKR